MKLNNPIPVSSLLLSKTVTPGGTNGDQTINKPAGTVNIATAGSSVTVTNSLVTVNSLISLFLRSNDTTAKSAVVVASNGSFVITLNAPATADISIGWAIVG